MEFVEVTKYMLRWDAKEHEGSISLFWRDANDPEDALTGTRLDIADALEYQVLVDVLRNEKPVFFHREARVLTTQKEDVGENE
ncbi:MAG: hypothetical protein ACTSU5_15820 [Promethearchaeota archaeon]